MNVYFSYDDALPDNVSNKEALQTNFNFQTINLPISQIRGRMRHGLMHDKQTEGNTR